MPKHTENSGLPQVQVIAAAAGHCHSKNTSPITETTWEVGIWRPVTGSWAAQLPETLQPAPTSRCSIQQTAQQRGFVNPLRQHAAAELNQKWLQGLNNARDFLPFQQPPCNSLGHRQTHHCMSQRDGGRSSGIACRAVIQWPVWLLEHLVKLLWLISGWGCQIHFQFLI